MKISQFYFLLIISIFLLINCKKEEPNKIEQGKNQNRIDSLNLKILKLLKYNEETKLEFDESYFPNFKSDYKPTGERTNVDSMIQHYYKIRYRGEGENFFSEIMAYDSLNYPLFFDEFKFLHQTGYSIEKFNQFPDFDLAVFVDTTQFVKNERKYYPKIKTGDEYPVYLINQSNKWYFKWLDSLSFTIILEAYHKGNQQWQPIEYQTTHSGFYMILSPKSYIVTSALIYDGNYQTKLRLKFKQATGMTYSNEFYGRINKSQFDTISKQHNSLSVYHF